MPTDPQPDTAWEYDCVIYNGVTDEARTLESVVMQWAEMWRYFNEELGPRGWEMVSVNQTGEYSLMFVFKRRCVQGAPATQHALPRAFSPR